MISNINIERAKLRLLMLLEFAENTIVSIKLTIGMHVSSSVQPKYAHAPIGAYWLPGAGRS